MIKKGISFLLLACILVFGLSACSLDKEPEWSYDANKHLFTGQEASVQVLGANKIESPDGQRAVRVHYQLSNQGTETLNAYTLLMNLVLDVKQEDKEVSVASLVFSKDEDRDKQANKCQVAPKQSMEVVVDYNVDTFESPLEIAFSDYGTEVDATTSLDVKDSENAPVTFFETNAS